MHGGDFHNFLIPTSEVVLVTCNETLVGFVMSAGNRNDPDSFPSSILGDVQASIKTSDTAGAVIGVMNIKSIFVVVEVVNFTQHGTGNPVVQCSAGI